MVMLNWALRYAPVVRFLGRIQGTILEVGSGHQGLAAFLGDRRCVGVDLEFREECHPNLIPVRASAQALPFPDCAFDCVVSIDMLEHIPRADRASVVAELLRVTGRYLVLGFPSGEAAMQSDRRVMRFFRVFGMLPDWLEEHLSLGGHPTVDGVQNVVEDRARLLDVKHNSNANLHALIVIADHLPIIRWLLQRFARVGLISVAAPLLDAGRTYREILFYEKSYPSKAKSYPISSWIGADNSQTLD
jgi:SAM-dependent methyltransferase